MAYIPTPKDLLWTLNCIHTGNPWAVPSGGSVFIFKHETFEFKTFTLAEKNDVQLNFSNRLSPIFFVWATQKQAEHYAQVYNQPLNCWKNFLISRPMKSIVV